MTADAKLASLLQDHANAVDEFFHRAAGVTSGRWNLPRAEGKWSPALEVKHVILAYEAFIRDLEGGEPMKLVGTRFKRMLWRAVGLTMIIRGKRLPRGARAPRESRPGEGEHDQQALLNEFRDRTTRFESRYREVWQRTPGRTVTHPYFGQLDLVDAMKMCTVHTRHHAAVLPPTGARQNIGA